MDKIRHLDSQIGLILKVLESNEVAISQISWDLGELRRRLDLLEGELESLFKK